MSLTALLLTPVTGTSPSTMFQEILFPILPLFLPLQFTVLYLYVSYLKNNKQKLSYLFLGKNGPSLLTSTHSTSSMLPLWFLWTVDCASIHVLHWEMLLLFVAELHKKRILLLLEAPLHSFTFYFPWYVQQRARIAAVKFVEISFIVTGSI